MYTHTGPQTLATADISLSSENCRPDGAKKKSQIHESRKFEYRSTPFLHFIQGYCEPHRFSGKLGALSEASDLRFSHFTSV